MTSVAIEQMLELWCVELRQVKAYLRTLFAHPRVATSAAAFLDGLLGPERRKTGWMRAEAAGDRVGALDGTLQVDSAPGAGTSVRGRIPLPPEPEATSSLSSRGVSSSLRR